jgi:uncharacterized protein (TIGR00730 family)
MESRARAVENLGSMSDSRYRAVKAYQNQGWINGRGARPHRILAEYLEPESRFEEMGVEDTIVIFGSARILPRDVAEERLAQAKQLGEGIERAELAVHMSRFYEDTRVLSARLTTWSKSLVEGSQRFVICSGGGPGIMEAANRGASEAKGVNVGLNISLPFEQNDNPYITRKLSLEFHYFFMRQFWFTYLAKAIIVMPGGFGTLDEFMEVVTLVQTFKIKKDLPIVLFGTEYWSEVLNFGPLIKYGTISPEDVDLFYRTDSVDDAFEFITKRLLEGGLPEPGAHL